MHLIPRYDETDGFSNSYANNMENYTPEMLAALKEEVIKSL